MRACLLSAIFCRLHTEGDFRRVHEVRAGVLSVDLQRQEQHRNFRRAPAIAVSLLPRNLQTELHYTRGPCAVDLTVADVIGGAVAGLAEAVRTAATRIDTLP